jgi:hypothetical protein
MTPTNKPANNHIPPTAWMRLEEREFLGIGVLPLMGFRKQSKYEINNLCHVYGILGDVETSRKLTCRGDVKLLRGKGYGVGNNFKQLVNNLTT